MSKIGLQMYTMRNHIKTLPEYKETLRKISDIGYRVLQTTKPDFISTEDNIKLLKEHNLIADSVLRGSMEVVQQAASAAKEAQAYGCDVLRTTSIPGELHKKGIQGYREFAQIMNQSGKACKDVGLRYMYHFHAFEWINFGNERGIDILLNETDPECVYFCPDVYWLANAGTEPSKSLRMFEGRAFTMHVKDYAIRPLEGKIENVPYTTAPVGKGNLNWEGIMKTSGEIGIQRFVVEQDECDGDVFAAIKESFDSLTKMGLK